MWSNRTVVGQATNNGVSNGNYFIGYGLGDVIRTDPKPVGNIRGALSTDWSSKIGKRVEKYKLKDTWQNLQIDGFELS